MKTRRSLLFVVLLVALATLAVGVWWARRDPPRRPPDLDLSEADAEVAELIQSSRREVLADPRSGSRWGRLGMVLRAHGFGAEANDCFAEAERLDPREPRWPYYRGLTLVLSEPEAGSACLRRAIARMEPRDVMPRFRLVEILLEQSKQEEAERLLDETRAASPGHLRGRLLAARLALARQEGEKAVAALEGCWDDRRTRRQARLLAAEAWQRMKDASQAEQLQLHATRLPPDEPWRDPFVEEVERLTVGVKLRLAEASSLSQAGQPVEAIRLLEQVVEKHPTQVGAWVLLGQLHSQIGAAPAAERAFARAVELDAGNVVAWFGLGALRRQRGSRDAADAFREAARLKPDYARAHHYLGLCLKDQGDREGARASLRQALRCQPDDKATLEALAELDRESEKRR